MNYELESDFPTLSNAPITEALIDIQVELPQEMDLETLRTFYAGIEDRFPSIDQLQSFSGTMEVGRSGPEMKVRKPPTPNGFIMRSDKEALIVQARLDGFTLNKMAPYISWNSLVKRAKDLWDRYVRIARPIKVRRLAVRYVNRLELLPNRDFKEFMLTAPEIAPGIPQGLPEFFMRLVIPHPSGSTAIVTQSSLPISPDAETVSVLFDIDVFRQIDVAASDESFIWSVMQELRAYKNLIFFQTIKPTLLEKYK